MMRTGNPALRGDIFTGYGLSGTDAMTIQGTVNKTFVLLFLAMISAFWAWTNPVSAVPFMVPAVIAGFITALITVFKKEWAPVTAPVYALAEGVFLGTFSLMFEVRYPGIVPQAIALTFGTLLCLLAAYRSGLIKVTDNLRLGIISATGAIALVYFVSFILSLFGARPSFIYGSGIFGILFSVVVVAVAALNLVLDFDFIERGAESGAPVYMEWYGAFGLMVTLIWLYIEILRLLSKSRR